MTGFRQVASVLLIGAALTVSWTQADGSTSSATPRASGRWTVGFHDGFDGSSLDSERWGTCFWWAEDDGCTILSNDEDQWYGPEQVRVADGRLHLSARPSESAHHGRTFGYASGMVSSGRPGDRPDDVARYAFTYGSVEVRFRTPAGGGLWPAVWMLPVTNESLPEIDLLEQYGDEPTRASMTLHAQEDGEQVRNRRSLDTADLTEGWHTVGVDWTEDRLVWFLDGTEVFRVEGDRVPREPMYLLANLAVGGNAGEPPADTRFPATLLIDEITVWRPA
ncbi:family 16 glycosylhydrolase [Aquihabitans daechungensis]|uniref:glycoside hydrolase family 16 protein n=1 Tax=Aquihabitans daechungensis TaxID=1052257 RepID=UPI003B9E361B